MGTRWTGTTVFEVDLDVKPTQSYAHATDSTLSRPPDPEPSDSHSSVYDTSPNPQNSNNHSLLATNTTPQSDISCGDAPRTTPPQSDISRGDAPRASDQVRVTPGYATAEVLRVKLLNGNAKMPSRGTPKSAGFDLSASAGLLVPAGQQAFVPTGLAIALPPGTYGRVAPRSGLAAKHRISVGAGVVDADFRGEVLVLLVNHGHCDFTVAVGDRIAQLIVELCSSCSAQEVYDLPDTQRGADGFGSTGAATTLSAMSVTCVDKPCFSMPPWDQRRAH